MRLHGGYFKKDINKCKKDRLANMSVFNLNIQLKSHASKTVAFQNWENKIVSKILRYFLIDQKL